MTTHTQPGLSVGGHSLGDDKANGGVGIGAEDAITSLMGGYVSRKSWSSRGGERFSAV